MEKKQAGLPTSPELERWFEVAREVERGLRKGDPRYTLEMKKAHVYVKVLCDGEAIGRFRPESDSTSVRAEVSSFNLARALGCGELFQRAAAMELHGKGLATFRHLLETAPLPAHREEERQDLQQAMEIEPGVLRGVFKPMPPASAAKYRAAERPEEPPNGGLVLEDVVARYLRHEAAQPAAELLELPGTGWHGPAATLARQLSNILLIDALAGQWDRFSGNNLHVVQTGGAAQFIALDNGGADPNNDRGYLEKFPHWVTRFDPPMAAQLGALEAFLHRQGRFRGFANEKALSVALGFDDPREWKAFRERVHRLAAQVAIVRPGARFEH